MRITSMDIENKEFKRVIRGYNPDEVDEFLDQIAEDYETIFKENSMLKERVAVFEEKVEHYKKIEDTIQNTLVLAQNAAEQAKLSAQKEAEIVIKNANDSAKRVMDKANNDVLKITDEYERLKQEFVQFRTKYRNFMKSQIEMFEKLEMDFDKSYNVVSSIPEDEPQLKLATEVKEKDIEINDKTICISKEDFNVENFKSQEFEDSDIDAIKTFFAK